MATASHARVETEQDAGTSQALVGAGGGGSAAIREERLLRCIAERRTHITRPALPPRAAVEGMGTSRDAAGLAGGCGWTRSLIGVAWKAGFDMEWGSWPAAGNLPLHLLRCSLVLIVAEATLVAKTGMSG